ncbi:phosphotransferase [Aestuariimicrobium sp. T2.26MG-19.2B]|uniref:phosphotransferase n=1 Tax=Aestuariimicrobium sp. T2.26MG-19.2B TaxID=3040679 RepID=UPI00406C23F6
MLTEPSTNPNLPDGSTPLPRIVRDRAAGRPVVQVWQNEAICSTTWRLHGAPVRFVKVGPPHREFEVGAHVDRYRWLASYLPVPHVLDHGTEDGLSYLVTEALPGRSAISHDFTCGDPAIVEGLGRALRRFHDSLPVDECPFAYVPADIDPVDLVVCHGDACNPNFLFDDTGAFTGYVDLGEVGIGDRWADLAPAILSLGWNFGEDPELHRANRDRLLAGYGIALDERKLAHYTDVWNAEPVQDEAHAGA